MADEWFYAHAGERFGPMSMDELQRAAADGRVKATDRAWTDGWPDWQAATDVPGLTFEAGGRDVGYFAAGTLPARAARTLKPYAPPAGDTGAWPLGEQQVEALADAVRHRRVVRRAVRACVTLAFAHLGLFVVLAVALIRQASPAGWGLVGVGAAALALAGLFAWCGRSIRRDYRAGGVVGVVLVLADVAVCLWVVVAGQTGRLTVDKSALTIYAVAAGVLVVLLLVLVGGLRRVPRFRATPAWCQEAILRSEAGRRA